MVDPIGSKPVNKVPPAPVAPVSATKAVTNVTTPQSAEVARSSLVAQTRELAEKPPVDAERVARIKKAVADGSFPITPATIADRILAFKLNWKPDEPA
jgi:negative regulator of flagellin synthesis FlgM